MDCNLAVHKSVIWNTAGALLRMIVVAAPDIRVTSRGVQLPGREELEVAMIESVRGNINGPGAVDSWWDFSRLRW